MAKLIEWSQADRRQTIYHQEDNKVFIETRQDVGPVIEAAKMLAEIPPAKEDGWRFLCAIPDTEYERALREGWFHDKEAWRRWMNDRDNRKFNGDRSNVG